MAQDSDARLAILSPGDREARRNTTAETSRFADLFRAFAAKRIHVEPAIYHDDFCEEVREQLMQVDGVLVWVNPIEGGRDRSVLDSMLRDVAAAGVFVSAHPDVILKLGTKEVLYRTRNLGWGCDTHLYASYGSDGSRAAFPTGSRQGPGTQATSRQWWKRRMESRSCR